MTPGHAKQLAAQVRGLDREIGALRLESLRAPWTETTGVLVVKLVHRQLDALDQIEDYLAARASAEAKEKERTASAIAGKG